MFERVEDVRSQVCLFFQREKNACRVRHLLRPCPHIEISKPIPAFDWSLDTGQDTSSKYSRCEQNTMEPCMTAPTLTRVYVCVWIHEWSYQQRLRGLRVLDGDTGANFLISWVWRKTGMKIVQLVTSLSRGSKNSSW